MYLDQHRNGRSNSRLRRTGLALLTLILLVLGLAGCERSYWDPTVRIGDTEGHLTDRTKPGTTPSGARTTGLGDEGIALDADDAGSKKAVDSVTRGTGAFVRRVTGPTVDTSPGDVTLNFDGTDIREVVKVILGDLLQVNYVLSPAVQGVASLQTGRPLRRDHLIPTLETLLRMNNAAMVYKAGTYEVVPVANAVQGNLVPQLGESTRALPEGYSVQVVPLRYISADEMNRILQPLAPEGSIIRVDTLRNLLVVAGTSPEMVNLIDTIKVFDVDWMKGLSVGFFVLEYAKANEVVTQLEGLLADDSGNPMKGLFRFIPVESSNSLMVISPQESYIQQARNWIERLDMAEATGSAAQRLFVYRVKYGDAENLANVLSELFQGESGERKQSVGGVAPGMGSSSIGSRAVIGQMGSSQTGGSQLGGSQSGGFGNSNRNTDGGGFSGGSGGSGGGSGGIGNQRQATARTFELTSEVSVVADAVNNSILVRSSPRDYKKILDALKQLDITPLQVLVEATIIEIKLEGSLRYGISWNLLAHASDGYKSDWSLNGLQNRQTTTGTTDPNTDTTVADTITTPLARTFPGFNWTIVANPSRIIANLSALAGQNLVNVLSSPSVMVMDNKTARIQVGDQVPVETTQQQSTITSNATIVNQIEYKDAGVILEVTPRVTPGGMVQMDIKQKVSKVAQTTSSNLNSPTFSTREIESLVAVRSNQAVVLGGLIQDDREEGKNGIPGLFDLPYAGALFGERSKKATRTELVVILMPKVITSDQDVEAVNADFRSRLRGLEFKF
ncbi:type II secretion system secretin GspD [Lamprocystis purpurea]|jgi:general secretion pathway protein D|uniref:type II secretion system secretin GspD n=1 Tax=Lamprocystis purpurea TaxID=61598 RepID=UPI0003824D64|nr:type II secretion system secretin GspD [Lamprocystis purpurea]